MGFYTLSKGALPQSSDVNQIITALQAALDVGALGVFNPISAPTTAPTAAINTTAGNLDSPYAWVVTFVTGTQETDATPHVTGETTVSAASNAISPANQQASLSAIPTGPTGTIARNLYRNKAGGSTTSGPWYLVASIAGNTTTTFIDNVADASLGVAAPTSNTTGTSLAISIGATAPVSPVEGTLWINTQTSPALLQYYQAGAWVTASPPIDASLYHSPTFWAS